MKRILKRTLISLAIALPLLAAGIFYGGLTLVQIATPANPVAGSNKLYFKSDNKLYSLTSSGTESEIGAGGSAFDPLDRSALYVVDEFCGGATTTPGLVGMTAMRDVGFGSGGVYGNEYETSIGNPCLMEFRTGASGSSGHWVGSTISGSSGSRGMFNWSDLYNKDWEVQLIGRLSSVADIRFRVGVDNYSSGITGAVNSASMWIRYDTNASYDDDAKASGAGAFVAQICGYDDANCSGNATGLTATLAGTVDTSFHAFRIYRSGGKINFQIDSNAAKTACLSGGGGDMTLPANPGYGLTTYKAAPVFIIGNDTTADKRLFVDRFAYKMTGLTR